MFVYSRVPQLVLSLELLLEMESAGDVMKTLNGSEGESNPEPQISQVDVSSFDTCKKKQQSVTTAVAAASSSGNSAHRQVEDEASEFEDISDEYNMDGRMMGHALIINNKEFQGKFTIL